jgi:hypothetical protein
MVLLLVTLRAALAYSILGETGPMVVSVNGVVASLAVTEFMVFVTGVREPVAHLIYKGHVATVGRNNDPPEPAATSAPGFGAPG